MSNTDLANMLIEHLGLEQTPVALAIVENKPADIKEINQRVPSACTFWRMAETEIFYASGDAHGGCAVGMHVMGFPLSAAKTHDLLGAIEMMSTIGYLADTEAPNIPRVQKQGAGVVYGPLLGFPFAADCVLVWTTPAQAMLLGEALRTTSWGDRQLCASTLFGRPACGALACTINTQRESLSLGCTGMRTFTNIPQTLGLFVIPCRAPADLCNALGQISGSNKKMLSHYQAQLNASA